MTGLPATQGECVCAETSTRNCPVHGQGSGAPSWLEGLTKMVMLREAVASVSLSHDEGCRCTTCRAALGDDEALAEIATAMEHRS